METHPCPPRPQPQVGTFTFPVLHVRKERPGWPRATPWQVLEPGCGPAPMQVSLPCGQCTAVAPSTSTHPRLLFQSLHLEASRSGSTPFFFFFFKRLYCICLNFKNILCYNSHSITFRMLRCTLQRFFSMLSCATITTISSQNIFSTPERNPTPTDRLPVPQPRLTTSLSVSLDLPVLNILYEWNHTMCGLLCLTYFYFFFFLLLFIYLFIYLFFGLFVSGFFHSACCFQCSSTP